MKDISVLYSEEDTEDFAKYLQSLFQKGQLNLEISFRPIGELKDLKELNSYKIIVLLCSPDFIEFFDDESETKKFQKCFNNHPCLVCLQYYVSDDEVSRLKAALSISKEWKLFQKLATNDECTETIGGIFDILEEQNKPPPPIPKPIQKKQIRKSKRAAKIIPNTVYKANEQIAVIFQKPPNGTIQISFREFDKIVDCKQLNETTYLFRVPSLPKSGDVRMSILCNNEKTADCVLKIVKPNLAAFQCLDFLAQALDIDPNDKPALDAKLVTLFDQSIPADGTLAELMKVQSSEMPFSALVESDQDVPTLLHFAAKHGLEDLTCTIMDTPGSSAAYQIENKDGHDPSDLAELNYHTDLAEHMRMYFETQTMVEYIHLATDNLYSNQEDLAHEKDQNTEPVRSKSLKSKPTQPEITPEEKPATLPRRLRPVPPIPTEEQEKYSGMKPEEFMGMTSKGLIAPIQKVTSLGSSTHDELIDIGNAVKAGEFTIDEAERLYASWIDRNKCSQSKSLKERQQAIDDLRNQYQKVFKAPEKKRESVFAKLKNKVAPRKRSKEEPEYSIQIIHSTMERETKTHPPGRVSTISNSSSSSMDSRVSTFSSSSRGSMQEESESDSTDSGCDPVVYDVQRRPSNISEKSRSNSENRISLRQQYMKQIENQESPSLPPRTSDTSRPPSNNPPPPPRKDRPPLPPPTTTKSLSSPETLTSRPVRLPPSQTQQSNVSPMSPLYKTEDEAISPISKRPPAPIPSETNVSKPSVKLPPRPPKKPKN